LDKVLQHIKEGAQDPEEWSEPGASGNYETGCTTVGIERESSGCSVLLSTGEDLQVALHAGMSLKGKRVILSVCVNKNSAECAQTC
jgi:hypothetical protein